MRIKVSKRPQEKGWFRRWREAAQKDCPGLEELTQAALDRIFAVGEMNRLLPCVAGPEEPNRGDG